MATAGFDGLDDRLRVVEDKLAIYELIASHPLSADTGAANYTLSVYCDDGVFDRGPALDGAKGAQEIAAKMPPQQIWEDMKTIGILGGMSAASTQIYYRKMCEIARQRLGGLHSPELLIRSLDFAQIEKLQANGQWDEAGRILNAEARALERGGSDFIVLATNTMHKLAEQMMSGVGIPLLHIADATADRITNAGFKTPGLMATAFTMEQAFYVDRLKAAALQPIIPDAADRAEVHRIIYDELCKDITTSDSRSIYEDIAQNLIGKGADCVILGCTEVGMLLNESNVSVPVFDTTLIHCEAAIDSALG